MRTHRWSGVVAISLLAGVARGASTPSVSEFPPAAVRLLDGRFKDAQDADRAYILAHNVDRLLAPFRKEAGLPEKAPAYGSWESMGLGGQTAGHYLSALSLMYASTGDPEMKRRLDYMVAELAACQAANGDGYVGGVPDGRALWADVAAGHIDVTGFSLNDRWVPWYNLHKTYAGLRDAYQIGGSEQARDVLIKLADWCDRLLGHLSDQQIQKMLTAEQGGMDEVLADVSEITGDPEYLASARRFCDQSLLGPLAAGQDELTSKHANTQIPKVIGFQRIAALGDDGNSADADALHRAAAFFWDDVIGRRTVAIGGNSVNEHFNPVDDFSSMIQDRTGPETCNTYNMLRLTEQLYTADPDPKYADYYERALFNHILSSEDVSRGGFVYFTPMRPRQYRVYSQAGKGFWCCVGTGFENHAKYGRFVYAHGGEGDALYVNLFIASELHWLQRGLTLRQLTTLPEEPRTRLRLSLDKPVTFPLKIRHPDWVPAGRLRVRVNGQDQASDGPPSSYVTVTRQWQNGDTVDVDLPMHVAAERLPDGSNFAAFIYGPVVLAAATGTEDTAGTFASEGRDDHIASGPLEPLASAPTLVSDDLDHLPSHVVPVGGEPLTFSVADLVEPRQFQNLKLVPFSQLHETRYEIYWPITTAQCYAAEQQRVAAAEREQLILDQMTTDRVAPGEQQAEVDHHFHGENTSQGSFQGLSWRDARGWFSYDLKAPANASDLLVKYYGTDVGRQFNVMLNGQRLAHVVLDSTHGDHFFDVRYSLPPSDVKTLTIEFMADPGSLAGGIFDLRVIERQKAASLTAPDPAPAKQGQL